MTHFRIKPTKGDRTAGTSLPISGRPDTGEAGWRVGTDHHSQVFQCRSGGAHKCRKFQAAGGVHVSYRYMSDGSKGALHPHHHLAALSPCLYPQAPTLMSRRKPLKS